MADYATLLLLFCGFATVRVYFQQGKMRKAETLLTQAIKIRSAGEADSELVDAQIQSNLGSVYERQRKYATAEESHKRSLEITERLVSPVHPYLTIILFDLGGLYIESRREDQYRHSLLILEEMSPLPDCRIVDALWVLSTIHLRDGEKTAAENACWRGRWKSPGAILHPVQQCRRYWTRTRTS